MERKHPLPPSTCGISRLHLLSRDEAIALFVALACAAGCVLLLLGLPTTARGEEAEIPVEVESLAEGMKELVGALGDDAQAEPAPAPSNVMPLVIVVAIMGVVLAIAFIVSRGQGKPQKLGGAKGDVW